MQDYDKERLKEARVTLEVAIVLCDKLLAEEVPYCAAAGENLIHMANLFREVHDVGEPKIEQ